MAEEPTLDLPAELQVLIDFLHEDDRPTVVVSGCDEDSVPTPDTSIVYQNTAFKAVGLGACEIERLLKGLRCSECSQDDAAEAVTADVRDMSWTRRPVGRRWAVIQQATSTRSDSTVEAASPDSAIGLEDSLEANGSLSPQNEVCSHDWTRLPGQSPSQWFEYVRNVDWASTHLGAMHTWSQTLRTYVLHIMSNPHPRLLIWGSSRTFIYNAACIPLFGEKHPGSLGQPASQVWTESWDDVGPHVDTAFNGQMFNIDRMPLAMNRNGFLEETYWELVGLPVFSPGENSVAGHYSELTDITKMVLGERRRSSIMRILQHISPADSLEDLWARYLQALEASVEDVPFALLYAIVEDKTDAASDSSASRDQSNAAKKCVLAGTVGVSNNDPGVSREFSLTDDFRTASDIANPCLQAWRSRQPIVLNLEDGTLPESLATSIPGRGFGDSVRTAIVLPVTSLNSSDALGIAVIGLNPRSPMDNEYEIYTHFLTDLLTKTASLISLPQEQRRTQKMADDINTALSQQLRLRTLEVENMKARFGRMARNSPIGMFVYDLDGRPLFVNEAFLAFLGDKTEAGPASPDSVAWMDYIHRDDSDKFHAAWHRSVEQKVPLTIEHRLKRPFVSVDKASGEEISGETWLLANAFPDFDSDGKVTSIQGWLTDISHRKLTQALIARKLEDALENKRQSENFIDMTSHEMRNPLSAILQSADSIVSSLTATDMPTVKEAVTVTPDIAHEIVDAAQTIILCAQHQNRIVDDILTLSKLDASLLVISPDRIQPPALLNKALKMYEAEIARADITVEVEIEPSYKALDIDWVVLDPSRLLQVVINLLTNAIKFTQHSMRRRVTISLGASYEKPTGKHHGVSFIPPQKPYQNPLADWEDGSEVYLQIAVTDTGPGLSKDEVKVLFQRFSQASPKTYKQYGGSGLGLFISRELCELQGGQIGVAVKDDKTSFTFFVLAKRPTLPGSLETARGPALPRVTSASASPMAFSRRDSKTQPGAEQTTTKARVGEAESKETITAVNVVRPAQNSSDKMQLHVLLVEDNLINQRVMSRQLRKAGCVVHIANHGLECLSFVEQSSYCQAKTPLTIILLDLEMPVMDGMECIRRIREQQLNGMITGHIPVIAVTANARSEQISLAIEAGMDSVVTKPFRVPELIPQMHALVLEVAQLGGG